MKRLILASVAALAFLTPVPSYAQTTGVAVEIAPDTRTRIKQYVVEEKIAPATITERVTVGATLPADVELHAVPQAWGPSVSRYRYVYYNDDVVLVEPSSRRVIQIID